MFGLIHIYCGDGKGKTTAAVGLAVRCAGRGNKVLLVQFLKSRDSGELYSLAKLPDIEVMRGKESKKFTFQMNEEEKLAYEWAKNQKYQSVAAQYAKILSDYIDHTRDLLEQAAEEIENVYGKETVLSVKIRDSLRI